MSKRQRKDNLTDVISIITCLNHVYFHTYNNDLCMYLNTVCNKTNLSTLVSFQNKYLAFVNKTNL